MNSVNAPLPLNRPRQARAERARRLVGHALAEANARAHRAPRRAINVYQGLSVTVRLGEVETVEHNRDKGLALPCSSASAPARPALRTCRPWRYVGQVIPVRAACDYRQIHAPPTTVPACADPALLAREFRISGCTIRGILAGWTRPSNWRGVRQRRAPPTPASPTPRARRCRRTPAWKCTEQPRGFSPARRDAARAVGGALSLRTTAACSVITGTTSAVPRTGRPRPAAIGHEAAQRAVRRLGGRKLNDAPRAGSVRGTRWPGFRCRISLRRAAAASTVRRRSRWIAWVNPCSRRGCTSRTTAAFAGRAGQRHLRQRGRGKRPRDLVRAGVLLGYVLDLYSARKLKLQTTGNAGGVHNLTLELLRRRRRHAGRRTWPGLLPRMGTGLLVTELHRLGVNTVTGDYSRGAAGFWVENGAIQSRSRGDHCVAGKLQDMFRGLVAVARRRPVRQHPHRFVPDRRPHPRRRLEPAARYREE